MTKEQLSEVKIGSLVRAKKSNTYNITPGYYIIVAISEREDGRGRNFYFDRQIDVFKLSKYWYLVNTEMIDSVDLISA